jgi:hypothetical protein
MATTISIKKKVSFPKTQLADYHPYELFSTHEERKVLCWYTEDELIPSREDARQAMHALHEVNGDVDAVLPNKGVCLRGLEKYADAVAKVMGQRQLVESVLRQQSVNRDNKTTGEEHLAIVSRYISQPFKDVARYYAVKTAEDEQRTRHQQQQETIASSWIQIQVETLIATNETNSKRARPVCFEETSHHRRSVKQCVQVSE